MSEYYAVIRSTDHLAHYGVKGMKWGVRKAIAYGNDKALDRHFRKAAKKLRKLQDIGSNSPKYAAKAAAYGAAAAGTASIAIPGTAGISKYLGAKGKKYKELGLSLYNLNAEKANTAAKLAKKGKRLSELSEHVKNWGEEKSSIIPSYDKPVLGKDGVWKYEHVEAPSKNTVLRVGTGLAALGFAAKAGQNAYRASHGAKYRAKASEFKTEMDNVFRGTKYEGQYVAQSRKRKRR